MFNKAAKFNGNILFTADNRGWYVGRADVSGMLFDATAFNRNLHGWCDAAGGAAVFGGQKTLWEPRRVTAPCSHRP
jgi:hypothetical protein